MNRSLPALTLCLLLAACKGGSPAEAPSPTAAPAATPTPSAAPAVQAPTAATPSKPAPDVIFRFAFAAKTEDSKDPRIVDWGEDGCGRYPIVKVDSIPLSDPWLIPDKVVEFDAKGQEIRHWGKPMGAQILELGEDSLLFHVDDKFEQGDFSTDQSGRVLSLRLIDRPRPLEDSAKLIDCPALPSFAESDYEQCYLVKDTKKVERRLAWEGPCT